MIKSADEFVRLRTSEHREEYFLAANDEAPLSVWLDVIGRFPEMKEWVAHNKTVPLEILDLLAEDAGPRVRAAVADKRKLSRKLFEILSRDCNEVVRHRIACNSKTPIEVLKRLAIDDVTFVRRAAEKRLCRTDG
jgi:CRISPR/Cas system-associated protein Cas10 (large subunit of type III CRISPR-Cas system)